MSYRLILKEEDPERIQHDGTEEGVANELLAQGVPKADIVLAFHSPFRRQFTDFAVG